MIDLSDDKEKIIRKLNEIESEIPILLKRIEKAKKEIVNVKTLEDARIFEENNDLNGGLMHLEVF